MLDDEIKKILDEPLEPAPCANCGQFPLQGCEILVETGESVWEFCGWPCLLQFCQEQVSKSISSASTIDGWDGGIVQVS